MIQNQINRLLKGSLVYGIGGVINQFIGFFLLPLFTSYLQPEDYGIVAMLSMFSFFVTPFLGLGLSASLGICYFQRENPQERKSVIMSAVWILLVSSIVAGLTGFCFTTQLGFLILQSSDYPYLVQLRVLTTCLAVLTLPFMLCLQFEERAKTVVLITSITTFLSMVLNVVFVVYMGRGVEGLLESGLIIQFLSLFMFVAPIYSYFRSRFRWAIAKDLLYHGLPTVPSFLFLFIIQNGNKYALQWIHGLDQVGIFNIGCNMGAVINLIVFAFTNAWTPFFMSFINNQADARILFGRVMTYYIFGVGFVSMQFFFFAHAVVQIMTHANFHESYLVVGLSALTQFMLGVHAILLPGMYFAKEVRYISPLQSLSAVFSILMIGLLIPAFGMVGSAWVLFLGTASLAGFQVIWNRYRRHDYLQVEYDSRRIGLFISLFVVCVFISTITRLLPLWQEIPAAIVLSGGSLFLVYALLYENEKAYIHKMKDKVILFLRPLEIHR